MKSILKKVVVSLMLLILFVSVFSFLLVRENKQNVGATTITSAEFYAARKTSLDVKIIYPGNNTNQDANITRYWLVIGSATYNPGSAGSVVNSGYKYATWVDSGSYYTSGNLGANTFYAFHFDTNDFIDDNSVGEYTAVLCVEIIGNTDMVVVAQVTGKVYLKNLYYAPGYSTKAMITTAGFNISEYGLSSSQCNNVTGYSLSATSFTEDIARSGALITDAAKNASDIYCIYKQASETNAKFPVIILGNNNEYLGHYMASYSDGSSITNIPTITDTTSLESQITQKTNSGYVFDGLYVYTNTLNTNAETMIYDSSLGIQNFTISNALVVYPKYHEASGSTMYKIRYNFNGADTYNDFTISRNIIGQSVTIWSQNLYKDGFDFVGWSTNANATTSEYSNGQTVTFSNVQADSTINLYAIWEARTLELRIVYDDVDLDDSVYYLVPGATISITDPVVRGYTFVDYSQEIPSVMPNTSLTIHARFRINKYNIILLYYNGGTLFKTVTLDYNTVITSNLLPIPTDEGYTFTSWNKELPERMPACDITLYAKWETNTYTISFNTDGGDAVESISQKYKTAVTAPEEPKKIGYIFKGWVPSVPETMPAENTVCVAQWEAKDVTITCVLNNGEENATYTFRYGEEITGLVEPTKEYYEFVSWDKEVPQYASDDLILSAVYEIKKYTIKINDCNNVDYEEYEFEYGETISIPTPEKIHYDFVSYTESLPETMPGNDIEVTCLWVVHKYRITFDTDGGTTIDDLLVPYKTRVVLPANPTKEGCEFVSWDQTVPATLSQDINLKAIWKKNSYSVKFMVDNTVYYEETVEYEGEITIPENPTAVGCTFISWDQEIPSKMPANNMVFTAVLDKLPCKVNFYGYDNELIETVNYYYGDMVTKIDAPAKKYFNFIGWYTTKAFTQEFNFSSTKLTGDVNIYAKYVEYEKLYSITLTCKDLSGNEYTAKITSETGFYSNLSFSFRAIPNEDLDKYDASEFYYDYSKNSGKMGLGTYVSGAIYTINVTEDGETYKFYPLDVTLEIDLPEAILTKQLVLSRAGDVEGQPYVISDYTIDEGKIKFKTDKLAEFILGYEVNDTTVEKKGCNTKAIYEILGIVMTTATALFILRKKSGAN